MLVLLMLTFAPHEGRVLGLTIMLGCLAAVLVPYCLFPWLLKDVLRDQLKDLVGAELKDIAGAFLLGWKEARDDMPEPEPTDQPLHLLQGGVS